MQGAFKHLKGWKGKFDGYSTGATVYSYTLLKIYDSLLHRQLDQDKRAKLMDSYEFTDFFSRLVLDVKTNKDQSRFNRFCEGYHSFYKKENHCAYNIAVAFGQAYK